MLEGTVAVFMAAGGMQAVGTPAAGMQADTIDVTMAIAGDMFMPILCEVGVFTTR